MLMKLKLGALKAYYKAKDLFEEQDGGITIVEIIIVLAIVIALAIVFKQQLKVLFESIWSKITQNGGEAAGKY